MTAGHVQQVRGELCLQLRAALDGRERPLALLGRELARPEQLDPAEQRVEGRAQLVREGGQELVLQAVGLLRLPVELLVLPREPPQAVFRALQLADVEEGAHRAAHLPLVVEERRRVLVQRDGGAVGVHHVQLRVLHLGARARGHLQRKVLGGHGHAAAVHLEGGPLVRVQRRERRIVAGADAEHVGERGVDRDVPALGVGGHANAHGHQAEQRLELELPALDVAARPSQPSRQHRDADADEAVERQRVGVLAHEAQREVGPPEEGTRRRGRRGAWRTAREGPRRAGRPPGSAARTAGTTGPRRAATPAGRSRCRWTRPRRRAPRQRPGRASHRVLDECGGCAHPPQALVVVDAHHLAAAHAEQRQHRPSDVVGPHVHDADLDLRRPVRRVDDRRERRRAPAGCSSTAPPRGSRRCPRRSGRRRCPPPANEKSGFSTQFSRSSGSRSSSWRNRVRGTDG